MTTQRRLESVLVYVAALTAAALPAYLLRFSILGVPTTALELLIYGFVTLIVIGRWGNLRLPPMGIRVPVILFMTAAVVSTIISPDKREALGIVKAWIFDPILLAWGLWQIPDRVKLWQAASTGLIAGGLVAALTALGQYASGQVTVDGRVVGLYAWSPVENASPNYLALYLGPIAVLTFGLAWRNIPKGRAKDSAMEYGRFIFLAGSFIAMVLAMFFSLSRGGLAAVAIGMASILVLHFWSWIKGRSWAKPTLISLIALVLLAGWYYVRPNPNLSPEEGGRITASNNVRWEIWKTTMKDILGNQSSVLSLPNWVTGVGLGNYQEYFTKLTQGRINYDRIAPLALTPHNLFLALWVNLGLVGLASFGWLMFVVFRAGLRSVAGSLSAPLVPFLGALVALLAHGLLDTPYFKNDLSALFWILVALLLLWSEDRNRKVAQT